MSPRWFTAAFLAALFLLAAALPAARFSEDEDADDAASKPAPARTVKAKAQAQEDAEDEAPSKTGVEALAGEAMADAFDEARLALRPWLKAKPVKASKRRGKAKARKDPKASGSRADLAKALETARGLTIPATAANFKTLFLAVGDQGLKGLALLDSGDRTDQDQGKRMAELAAMDLESLAAASGEKNAKVASAASGKGSVGFDLLLGGYQDFIQFQIGGSYGVPIAKYFEAGGGARLGFDNRAGGGQNALTFNYGLDLYGRANLFGAFGTPLVVPYVGAHMAFSGSLGTTWSYDTNGGSSDNTGTSFAIGPQAGLLFYLNRRTALNLGGQFDYTLMGNSSTSYDKYGKEVSNSKNNTGGGQFVASLGLRFML